MKRQEPIAIVGMGAHFPRAADRQAVWQRLLAADGDFRGFPIGRIRRTSPAVAEWLSGLEGAFFEGQDLDPQTFRIPPVYAAAVAQSQLLMAHVARACVADAGYDAGSLPSDDVDVVTGTCFGFDSTLSNVLKVEGVAVAHERSRAMPDPDAAFDEMREQLRAFYGCSSHDRVGEMASSIPARIASMHGLRGRVHAIENADATGYSVLEAACMSLTAGDCRAVMAVTAQRFENALIPLALAGKGVTGHGAGDPMASASAGVPLGEGAVALLLKRLPDALSDGDRVLGVISGMAARQSDRPSGFHYAADTEVRRLTAEDATASAGTTMAAVDYVDCVLPGVAKETEALTHGLAAAIGPGVDPVSLGSSVSAFGYTFANATLTGIAATCQMLGGETRPATPAAGADRLALPSPLAHGGPAAPWPARGLHTRQAAVAGGSVTGLTWQIIVGDAPRDGLTGTAVPVSAVVAGGGRGPARPAATPRDEAEPIAIVGMGGHFGPCGDAGSFWKHLDSGYDAIQPIDEAVLPREVYYSGGSPRLLSSYADKGAALATRSFDLTRFKVFPKRAQGLDIAQQLALTVAGEALADYGVDARGGLQGRGLVAIASNLCLGRERRLALELHRADLATALDGTGEPEDQGAPGPDSVDHITLDGCLASGISALVSSSFRLGAVPVAVEAACASSLAALHNAVLGLRQGRYDFALAGGVELPTNARDLLLCSAQMMLSPDRIAPFSEGADGFSTGDGAGVFVLKRLSDALAAGDTVHACITGVGGSSDARSMTAPDPDGQELAMRRAWSKVGHDPRTVQYVEAHGTGTRLGDIAEVTSLGRVYGGEGRDEPLAIGSVKSNFGHSFAAAGAAGLLKVLLAMRNRRIPPTILRRAVNPELALAPIPARIAGDASPWPAADQPMRAAVNSMGTGGINYHVLVESGP